MRKAADQIQKNIKDLPENKSFYMFLFCLLLSISFWSNSKLSKTYIYELSYEFKYVNIPIDKVFFEDIKDKIFIKVKANGFNLLKNKFFKKKLSINLSEVLKEKNEKYFWFPKEHLREISTQIGNMEIIELKSKNPLISLALSKLASKEVPIELDLAIKYKKGFKEKKILLTPSTLKITGPNEKIQKINSLKTKTWNLSKIHLDIEKELDLIIPKNVKTTQKKVSVHLMVEPYTEKVLSIPIKIINFPTHYNYANVKLSIEKVNLAFKVNYDYYKKVKNYDFVVLCDLSKITKGLNQVPLILKNLPEFLDKRDIFMYPDKIRVLVLEN